ncbi:MAG: glycine C-acetyltransferase, partial [Parcubacteria group bacterium Gr01-1014_33]
DDSHATGFMGKNGRGTPEECGVEEGVDVITSTYGKALGGAGGGFIAGHQEIIDLLRERSRTYLFSNNIPPVVAATSLFAIRYIEAHPELRDTLWENVRYFRAKMQEAGFTVPESVHPIVPIMIGDAVKTQSMSRAIFERGIYVVGFSYPVVPEGKARIRVQISAEHTREDLDRATAAFVEARDKSA